MRLARKKKYNRTQALQAAAKAAGRRRYRKAIVYYRTVLEHEPADYVTHGKLAPLLAAVKDPEAAWTSFNRAAEGYLDDGFEAKALSLYKVAAKAFPTRIAAWDKIAAHYLDTGRRQDAFNTLREACDHFNRRAHRNGAIRLLTKALEIEPRNFATAYDLARLFHKSGRRDEAAALLRQLETRARGADLKRVRGLLFRFRPGPATAWRWLRTQ